MKKEVYKKKILKVVLLSICLLVVVGIVCYAPGVLADVGNNNRYDTPSGGGSSSDVSGDAGDLFYLIYMLFDLFGAGPALIILAIAGFVYFKFIRKKKKQTGKSVKEIVKDSVTSAINNSNFVGSDNSQNVGEEIRKNDEAFSEDAFIGWVREVFIKIQQAWTKREWNIIRPFESNELFSQHSSQLQEYIDNNKINVIEKIKINHVSLLSYSVDGDKEVLKVKLQAVMRDYVIDANTKEVLESDPNRDYTMNYIMTFNRKVGVKTKPGTSNKSTTNCPNCGAPTRITSSGQCDYCDSVITTGEHDWVLSDITSEN